MVELGTVLSFIQAAGIIVGVAYYILNIQNNRRNQELSLKAQQQTLETRQTQLTNGANLVSCEGDKLFYSSVFRRFCCGCTAF